MGTFFCHKESLRFFTVVFGEAEQSWHKAVKGFYQQILKTGAVVEP